MRLKWHIGRQPYLLRKSCDEIWLQVDARHSRLSLSVCIKQQKFILLLSKKRRNFFYIPCFRLGRVIDQRCLEYQMQN